MESRYWEKGNSGRSLIWKGNGGIREGWNYSSGVLFGNVEQHQDVMALQSLRIKFMNCRASTGTRHYFICNFHHHEKQQKILYSYTSFYFETIFHWTYIQNIIFPKSSKKTLKINLKVRIPIKNIHDSGNLCTCSMLHYMIVFTL